MRSTRRVVAEPVGGAALRGACQPGVLHHLGQLVAGQLADPAAPQEDRQVPVEVRGREERRRLRPARARACPPRHPPRTRSRRGSARPSAGRPRRGAGCGRTRTTCRPPGRPGSPWSRGNTVTCGIARASSWTSSIRAFRRAGTPRSVGGRPPVGERSGRHRREWARVPAACLTASSVGVSQHGSHCTAGFGCRLGIGAGGEDDEVSPRRAGGGGLPGRGRR